ncbi:MAG: endo-1,4-beta-xylanase [Tannerella sp.]|jgi:GH35 family endo-1,4-beta-xylanase|nr:endo-1,4-beta-xylanase [Tannerella sp.]
MKHISKILMIFVAAIWVSCVEEYTSDYLPEKPDDVATAEFLNGYDVLKSYIDKNASPSFMLGTGISQSDFLDQGTLFSLTLANFDEITVRDVLTHASVVSNDGEMDFSGVQSAVNSAKDAGLSLYGYTLVSHTMQNAEYLNRIIADVVVPIIPESGETMFADFESDATGDEYRMTNPATGIAKVADDPKGQSGKVLHLYGPDGPDGAGYNQSFPEFDVVLPEGRKLGDYVSISFDVHVNDNKGIFGQGIRMAINGKEAFYGSFADFGAPNNNWGRNMVVLPVANIGLSAGEKELTSFTLSVGNRTGGGNYYIDNVKGKYEITAGGVTVIADFESDAIGKTYPMTNPATGVATVSEDPKGVSGKVLHLYGPDGPGGAGYNQSFPIFTVTLPPGRKLGDYTRVMLDVHINDDKGIYGQGFRLAINGRDNGFAYNSPSGFGCPNNNWGRGLVSLPLASLDLTAAEKELTQFELSVANRTGGGNYYIDNVAMEWEADGNVFVKTPEEKKEILTNAMEAWISGLMEACEGNIKIWDVINEPMDDDNPTELKGGSNASTLYWQDYLGKEYARTAVRLVRQHGGNDLKLFVNDYGLEIKGNAKCKGLIEMIEYWEEDGVTKIDGIGTQMHVTYSLNATIQKTSEDEIIEMFNLLQKTGKLIRISALDINLTNSLNLPINMANATVEQQKAMSKFYNFIIRKYFEIIPPAQQAGITHWNSLESATHVGLWNSSFNRKYTFTGFADGLAGKEASTK